MRFSEKAQAGWHPSTCAFLPTYSWSSRRCGRTYTITPPSPPFALLFHVTAGPYVEQMFKTSLNCW